MKKVIYIGGFFQAEYSMQIAFEKNKVQMLFLFDESDFGIHYWYNRCHKTIYKRYPFMKFVLQENFRKFLRRTKPDVIISRFYKSDPLMFPKAFEDAKQIGIPFYILKMETTGTETPQDVLRFRRCDGILYAHEYDENFLLTVKKPLYFYPYGVSDWERRDPDSIRDIEIGSFGYWRNYEERNRNIKLFLLGAEKIRKKVHVFEGIGQDLWKYYQDEGKDALVVHEGFKQEDTVSVMNRCRIALNIETLWHLDGANSHKLWQTLGCGIPTLTYYKKSLEKLFGNSGPIFVQNPDEVADRLLWLLEDEEAYNRVATTSYDFVHKHFDWFERFDAIMKQEKVWS